MMRCRSYLVTGWLPLAMLMLIACGERTDNAGLPGPPSPADEPAVAPDEGDAAAVASANARFAIGLYRLLAEADEENLFFSPYSIYTALAMTFEGARGQTADQMRHVLGVPGEAGQAWATERFHGAVGALIEHFNADDRPYELHVANALWRDQRMAFRDDFLAALNRHYGAELFPMDFIDQPEPSRVQINDWVEQQTQGRIEDLLPEGTIDPLTRLVLTNAIYFKAAWAAPFAEERTEDRPFYLADGTEVETPTMRQDDVRIGWHEGDGYQAVELPYEDRELSMLILLPDATDGLADGLDAEELEQIAASLEPTPARVELPKFSFESSFSLNEALEVLGNPLAFSPEDADFTGMSDTAEAEELHITDATHKAFIDVHEEGTEAAAATGVVVGITAVPVDPPHVRVDRPFLFLVRDVRTKTVLFFGRVTDPRQ